MGVSSNLNALSAVDHLGEGRVPKKSGKSKPILYRDDGKSIITTIPNFCREIDNNVALSFPRSFKGIVFPACEFNLVNHQTGIVLAHVFPLSAEEKRKRNATDIRGIDSGIKRIKEAIESGEPTILSRRGQKFAVLCPADNFVIQKMATLMKLTLE